MNLVQKVACSNRHDSRSVVIITLVYMMRTYRK